MYSHGDRNFIGVEDPRLLAICLVFADNIIAIVHTFGYNYVQYVHGFNCQDGRPEHLIWSHSTIPCLYLVNVHLLNLS